MAQSNPEEGLAPKSVNARGQAPEVLRDDFVRVRGELLEAHRAWSALRRATRDDPWRELHEADQVARLAQRRSELIDQLGRLALTWMLRGGRVELLDLGATPTAPSRSAPAPAAPPASAARLKAATLGPAWAEAEQSRPEPEGEPIPLPQMLQPLERSPADIPDSASVSDELRRLSRGIHPELTTAWVRQPREVQRALVGHVVARARRIQDELADGVMEERLRPELDRVFSTMTAFSKREQPGFVFGLMRSHKPVHGTWLDDARHWRSELDLAAGTPFSGNPEKALDALRAALVDDSLDPEQQTEAALVCLRSGVAPDDLRLVALLADHMDLLRQHTEFKKTRKAIRDAEDQDAEFEGELAAPAAAIGLDWPWWANVKGKRASIIGGDLRQDARQRIQEAFGFSLVDWVTTDHARNIQVLASAIKGGSVEFVIVLRRFIGHDVDRIILPACKDAGVPWVSVDRGYGVNQIKLAIERYLEGTATD